MNEEEKNIELFIKEYNCINDLNSIWNNPVLKMIRSMFNILPVPLNELVDASIEEIFHDFQSSKDKELCELIFSDESITLDDVKEVTFITDFARSLSAVRRLSSNKKVVYIANLFRNYHDTGVNEEVDEFEEFLSRLEDLSYRELKILAYLCECENKVPHIEPDKAVDQIATWDYFETTASKEFDLNINDIKSIMAGTVRSGFCNSFGITRPGHIKDVYYVTDYYKKFLNKISRGNT